MCCGLFGQKKIAVSALAQFDFAATNLANNDAGFGATLALNAFAQKRLQLRTEVSLDHFIGNKILLVDAYGIEYPSHPTVISVKAGPEFFLSKNLSVAGLYGYAAYSLFDLKVKEDAAKFILAAHFGKQKRAVANVYFQNIFRAYPVHFFGVGVGYRVL